MRARQTFLLALGMTAAAWRAAADEPVQLWDEAYVRVRPGATVRVVFHLSVGVGYYVVADGMQSPGLTPLALKVDKMPDITLGAPVYPKPPIARTTEGIAQVRAHAGTVAIGLPVTVSPKATWRTQMLRGTVVYQACSDNGKCQAPASLPVAIEVELRKEERGVRDEQAGGRKQE